MKRSTPHAWRRGRLGSLLAVIPLGLLCFAAAGTAAPTGSADLQITATANAGSVPVGGSLTYTITVTDLGPETATGVTVEDALPAQVRYTSASSTVGSCAPQGRKVVCSIGTLESGTAAKVSSATITLTVSPSKAGSVVNTFSVRGDQGDPVAGNNQASVTTAVVEGPKYAPPPTKPPKPGRTASCRGVKASIVGTPAGDTLVGTSGRDVIVTLGGNDTVLGRGGRDLICAGKGNDHVNAGGGADRAFGAAGKDRLLGRGGPDLLKGQGGDDALKGGTGSDRIRGGRGFDRCVGGPGRDSIRGCER
ncbi:MAG TPA: hypothetical protein VN522_14250 [Solirubrobacterales bacterium]|nr:hypothetical protein [Solirubrobacterales bacterium]